MRGRLQQLCSFGLLILFLFRVDLFFGHYACFRKKLLRLSTALSARPMVAPINFRHTNFSKFGVIYVQFENKG